MDERSGRLRLETGAFLWVFFPLWFPLFSRRLSSPLILRHLSPFHLATLVPPSRFPNCISNGSLVSDDCCCCLLLLRSS
jgi:hypothetical protein